MKEADNIKIPIAVTRDELLKMVHEQEGEFIIHVEIGGEDVVSDE